MKRTLLPAALIATLAAATLAADPEPAAQATLDRLIGAVQKNDLPTLLQHASPQMKEGLTQQLLDSVSKDLSPHLQKGYTATYLGDLHQRGVRVLLWKLTFKDGRDDALVRVAMQGEDVAGFFIQ